MSIRVESTMKNARMATFAGMIALKLTFPFPAFATERIDIVSGLNVLPLMMNKVTGDTVIAVVYDPADPASASDAQGIKKIVDSKGGNEIQIPGGGQLTAMLVGVNEFGKLSQCRIAFLTPGLTAHLDDINIATSAAGILTISTDIECVKAAKCIIGVATRPSLTIYFSKAAADNAKIEFSQTFSMLVKQP